MKVAIIGIGQIAEAHIGELIKIEGVEIVALVDLNRSPLRALCDKYNVPHGFTDTLEMLETCKPDVVYLATPPGPHLMLAKQCMENGSHVYIEKPLTITHDEAEQLLACAVEQNKKVCLGANRHFAKEQQAAFNSIANGEIGKISHIDSIFSYDLAGIFGRQVLANPNHWIAQLPGQIFQNNLNHPLTPILPFLSDELDINAWADDWTENGIVFEELRVNIFDRKNKLTASIIFTSNVKPAVFKTRYFGTEKALYLDNNTHTITTESPASLPGSLGAISTIRSASKQLSKQFYSSTKDFFFGRKTYFSDMKETFEAFYKAIETDSECPIPNDKIRLASQIMQEVFDQIGHPLDNGGEA